MAHEITTRDVPTQLALCIRLTTNKEKIARDINYAFCEIWDVMLENKYKCTGDFLAIYQDEKMNPDKINIECAITIERNLPEKGRVKRRKIEGGLMAALTHQGPYSELEGAYEELAQWIAENGYQPLSKMRERYINDPETLEDEEEILTEILWPVRKK